jgi:chromosomal replication initiator protein
MQYAVEWREMPYPWPELGPQIAGTLKTIATEPLNNEPFTQPAAISMAAICNFVCREYRIDPAKLRGHRRSKQFIEPRHIAMALCRHLTENTWGQIGAFFRRDHSSIVHAVQKVADDPALRTRTNILERRIIGAEA